MSTAQSKRPMLAITMGDPAGIGPEVTVKALAGGALQDVCSPLVIGDRKVLEAAAKVSRVSLDGIEVLDLNNVDPADWAWGKLSAGSGKAALEFVHKAMELTDSGKAAGIVTAPINKEACAMAGSKELGHMELFARVYKSPNQATMLVSGKLRCVHLSTHYSLKEAIARITRERIVQRLVTTHEDFGRWGMAKPRIAVSAINPHGGEGGLMGSEEQEHMAPAVADAKQRGIDARGPYPADTVYVRAMHGEFDAVIAMFHDQGHIPVKVHGFEKSVSVALGLPILRTSVDHGTAFDIAGKGVADELSMRESIRVAAEISAGTWLGGA